MKKFTSLFILTTILVTSTCSLTAQEQELELQDIMKFRHIRRSTISDNGAWVAYAAVPDRGDPDVYITRSDGRREHQVVRANNPVFSSNGKWVAMTGPVPALEKENAGSDRSKMPAPGLVLFNTSSGEEQRVDSVSNFSFSNDSRYLFVHMTDSEETKKQRKKSRSKNVENGTDEAIGSTLKVLALDDGMHEYTLSFVQSFAVDSSSSTLAYIVSDTMVSNNGVYMNTLDGSFDNRQILAYDSTGWASDLTFSDRTGELIFLSGERDTLGNKQHTRLYSWRKNIGEAEVLLSGENLEKGWRIWHKSQLKWSDDGMHIYLGTKPEQEIILPGPEDGDTITDLFDPQEILDNREVDVWHWDDPYINPHQKKQWNREKDRAYTGVFHLRNGHFVQLATPEMPRIHVGHSNIYAVGYSNIPYRKRVSWEGRYNDIYIVNMEAGTRKLVEKEVEHSVSISPDGKYLVYYKHDHWYLVSAATGEKECLTDGLEVPFYNEDWDYPADRPGYGVAGWVDRSEALLIYDKYDTWMFPTGGDTPVCLTDGRGRSEACEFRIRNLETDRKWYRSGERVLLSAYHDLQKHTAVYAMEIGNTGVEMLLEDEAKYTILARAKDAEKLLFTRETYREFPDLQTAAPDFQQPVKVSSLGKQTDGIAWGEASLIDWLSLDGRPIQGVLIRPGNYEPGKQYPVLVYYYRFFTDRLYEFPHMAINHRPNFAYYASNGYAVFLPDIRFDIGTPGYSATKCIVPGVQKLIDMGIADPDGIGLHGHSWSGYQTAFVVTQTNIFACAIAGAPVSNMTSAYSGIRWSSGLARQFQYEKTQSRIGGSLWEMRDKYIENSPVFFADRIETPLLIQFGDEDGAVPWYQGIELYLAMRRLEKDCVFLQYRGEPHHLKKYANKLDYTIKFKQYLDHYLKGEEAADWIRQGVPYRGE